MNAHGALINRGREHGSKHILSAVITAMQPDATRHPPDVGVNNWHG